MDPVSTVENQTPAGTGTTAAVAPGSPVDQSRHRPASTSAMASVPQFGGNRGGRPRGDGHPPGSEAAKAADRENARLRKAKSRANIRAQNPPRLPSVLSEDDAPGDSPTPTPGNSQTGNLVLSPGADSVAWDPAPIKELLDEAIPFMEQRRVRRRTRRASESGLSPKLLKEIEEDSHWPEVAKKGLSQSGSRLIAKYAPQLGLPAEHQDLAQFCTCLALIATSELRLDGKLDTIISNQEKLLKQQQAKP